MLGLISLVRQSGATIVGAGICIEKGFDVGGKAIRDLGIDVQSLAVIQEMQRRPHRLRARSRPQG